MKCPDCGYLDTKVLDSRPSEEGNTIRRRRECDSCHYRFTTYEKIEEIPIMVIKKSKIRQPFDRDKIINGLLKACEKRPISIDKIEEIVNKIEQRIRNSMKKEVNSSEIGEMVMGYLKELDEIAYVRFASVYRQFKDINVFVKEMKELLK
ncbi:MAG TPA: transcriptional repressor NrdR [Mollicutes bacterium]|nr:transcriptional repressor NrdR [Mollicutes bacterium]